MNLLEFTEGKKKIHRSSYKPQLNRIKFPAALSEWFITGYKL